MISAGIKLATRQDGAQRAAFKAKRARGETVDTDGAALEKENPKFRVLNDAVSQVLPYMDPEDVIVGDMGVLKTLVTRTYPLAREFEEPYRERLERCGK
jgi:multisite-specific tRNA:(cytosine-C5)-methyltransferase